MGAPDVERYLQVRNNATDLPVAYEIKQASAIEVVRGSADNSWDAFGLDVRQQHVGGRGKLFGPPRVATNDLRNLLDLDTPHGGLAITHGNLLPSAPPGEGT